ncbi:amidohydrolase family protein [Streptosporangium sp. NBC_01495]|uniref:amidohydrolase family protein n=1 Tax=Streptosporangium sp. NBC_01495 TaxID=2903899 RepID=UPI002E34E230|nr:amidohydrolase family protein [Streptosporangium sp. NBC_01495]
MRSDGVLPVELPDAVREALLAPLVDHNCHGVCRDDLTRARFETLLTDAGTPAPPGTTHFDTPAGAAVRRWCAPVLGLAPHVPPAVYLARRMELGAAEVNRRLLDAAGIATFLFDGSDGSDGFDGFDDSDGPGPEGFGGFEGSGDLGGPGGRGGAGGLGALGGSRGSEGPGAVDRLDRPDRFDAGLGGAGVPPRTGTGHAGGAETARVVHIERAEEEVAGTAVSGVSYISALAQNLAERAARAVALKSVTAHRSGHHLDPARPSRGAVIAAATRRLACPGEELTDQVLLRHLLWTAVDVAREYGRPLQFHTGLARYAGGTRHGAHPGRGGRVTSGRRGAYGGASGGAGSSGVHAGPGWGPDPGPHGTGPAPVTGFIMAVQPVGVPVVLLRSHPFHRQAASLAGALPHVYVDVGAALTRSATGSAAVMAELLELVPFHKQLFGSGGHGVAETCHLGALHYRRGLAGALAARLADGEWSAADAARVAQMIGSGNARRIYRL